MDHLVHLLILHLSHARFVLKHSVKILLVVPPHDPEGFALKEVAVLRGLGVVASLELEVLVCCDETAVELVGNSELGHGFGVLALRGGFRV